MSITITPKLIDKLRKIKLQLMFNYGIKLNPYEYMN